MSTSSVPNLFLVGFQKCGSSSLFDLLISHPEIQGTVPKETYFLVDDSYELFHQENNISRSKPEWSRFIEQNKGTAKYILEGSVCNFYQERALQEITASKENRVIFVIRDPVERFISTYKYYANYLLKFHGNINMDTYYELIKQGDLEKDACKYAVEHGYYSRYIDVWQKRLGPERVLVIGMPEMIARTKNFKAKLADFLELDMSDLGNLRHSNASETHTAPGLHAYLLQRFGGTDFPGKSWFLEIYRKVFYKKGKKVEISPQLRSQLERAFQTEYDRFGSYFK